MQPKNPLVREFQSTLLMRGATWTHRPHRRRYGFQSTLLMRGATFSKSSIITNSGHFNPRSSCEERLAHGASSGSSSKISIHAPHARSDSSRSLAMARARLFQSTLLMRGATPSGAYSRSAMTFQSTLLMRGATTSASSSLPASSQFQSTLLMRGATCTCQ